MNGEFRARFFRISLARLSTRRLSVPRLRRSFRRNFAPYNLKIAAVYSFAMQLLEKLQHLKNTFPHCSRHFDSLISQQQNPFGWLKVDWRMRFEIDQSWLRVFQRHTNEDCLQSHKLRTDLDDLMSGITILFEPLLQGNQDRQLFFDCYIKYLQEVYENYADNMFKRLLKERQELIIEFDNLQKEYESTIKFETLEEQKIEQVRMTDALLEDYVLESVKERYIGRYYQVLVQSVSQKCEMKEKRLNREIEMVHQRMAQENYSLECALNMYFSLIEEMRGRIREVEINYENALQDQIDKKLELVKHVKGEKAAIAIVRKNIFEFQMKKNELLSAQLMQLTGDDEETKKRRRTLLSSITSSVMTVNNKKINGTLTKEDSKSLLSEGSIEINNK